LRFRISTLFACVAAGALLLPAMPVWSQAADAPGVGDELPKRGSYSVTGTQENVTVSAVGVDAQELFTALAAKTNLPLVIDDTVSRRLTINIINRPARKVVEDIVSAYGLSSAEVDGVIMISEGIPRSPSSYLLSDIASVQTKYVDANNARNLLPVFLQDYVKVNSEQNSVILSAPTEVLQKFRGDIAQFDIPASQIVVDLMLIEVTKSTADQLGLTTNWQNGGRGISVDPGAGSVLFKSVTNLPKSFSATLTALQEKGLAKVRANPRIATLSGRRANVFVGTQRYLATPIDIGGGRNYIDAGVRLNITPYTGGQGQILVDVDSEVSTLSAPDPITHLPEKGTRTASTAVRVNDGQTIVIGGLTQQETRDVHTKVPILGDIPIIGPLFFQTKSVTTSQTELVLLITPRLLSDTGHLPDAEESAIKQRFLDNGDAQQPIDLKKEMGDPTIPIPTIVDKAAH
jgi:type II secretory pathway component GspD/PulD (secretin)